MTENQSKEGVAFELVKYIYASNGGDSSPEGLMNLYSECLGVVEGKTLELTRVTMKREKEAVANI